MGNHVGELSESNRVKEATAKAHVVMDVADWVESKTHVAAPQVRIIRAIRDLGMDVHNRKALVDE